MSPISPHLEPSLDDPIGIRNFSCRPAFLSLKAFIIRYIERRVAIDEENKRGRKDGTLNH